MSSTPTEPVDLLAALEKALGRTLPEPRPETPEERRRRLTEPDDFEPDDDPYSESDLDYFADQAADRYERDLDSRW